MRSVNIRVARLLEELRVNRDIHVKEYRRAHDAWEEKVVETLAVALDRAREGIEYKTSFHLPEPKSYEEYYDRAIAMLEMSIDDTMELTQDEFGKYVLNDWEWAQQFKATTSRYT